MIDDDPLLDKVRKLLAKAEATRNEHEADAFASKAAALIAAHRIDPARLARARAGGDEVALREVAVGRGAYVRARLALLGAVAGAHDCEIVWRTGPDGATGILAGFTSDLDATVVLYESLHLQATSRMAAVRRATPAATQRWRRAFLFGYADRVGDLLRESRRRVEADVVARGGGSAALPDLPGRAAQVRAFATGAFGRVTAAAAAGARGGGRLPPGPRRGRQCRHRAGAPGRAAPARAGFAVTADRPDAGRAAVYAAEDVAFGGTELDVPRPIDELVALADRLTAGEWWAAVGAPVVTVAASRAGACSSTARSGHRPGAPDVAVHLAAGQHTVATLAHELAHALAGIGHGHDARSGRPTPTSPPCSAAAPPPTASAPPTGSSACRSDADAGRPPCG